MARKPFDGNYAVSQQFGAPHPRYARWGLAGHNGVDYAIPMDVPILAPADGEVLESQYDGGFGYYVKIRTPDGEDWLLAHMQCWHLPRPGEWVAAGAPIGFCDSTGESTGPHLHLGYRSRWWVRGWPYNGYEQPPPFDRE